LNPEPPGP